MSKKKIRLYKPSFLSFTNSISLREECAKVKPRYFEWEHGVNDNGMWFPDGSIVNITQPHEVGILIEPRCLRPENYKNLDNNHVRLYLKNVLTYDRQLLEKYPDKCRFYPLGGSSIAFHKWGIYPKTKNICMILSEKTQTEGHKLRHRIYERYKDSGLIDFYGAGAGRPFESKFDVLKDYRYCIVVESCFEDFYFTEKLIDPISVGTVPFYYGCPSIENYFENAGMWNFRNMEDLAYCIGHTVGGLASGGWYGWALYNHIQQTNLEQAKKYRIAEDYIYENYTFLFGAKP